MCSWVCVIALIACGHKGTAQLFSVEKTVSVAHSAAPSDATAPSNAVVPSNTTNRRSAEPTAAGTEIFEVTPPETLFSGNVVYVQPPGQGGLELEIPPMPDFSQPKEEDPLNQVPPLPPGISAGCADEAIHNFKIPNDDEDERLNLERLTQEPYSTYRSEQTSLAWLTAHGEHFGWLDWQSEPYLRRGNKHGLTGAINIHWLSGPGSSPLPPRLYDFILGYQVRNKFSDQLSYDLYTSIGAYSDFEDSARDGIRFPSHAVGMFHINHSTDVVFGIDYLDRDDIAALPVFGVSLRDVFTKGLRVDLVFPRPRIDYALSEKHRMYLAGLMNGGTWDIEFPNEANHVMTYRDYRLLLGFESADKDGSLSAWEFGYVFGRNLEFRDVAGKTQFDDAFVIQWVTRR